MVSQFRSIKTNAWFGMVQQTKESISRVLLTRDLKPNLTRVLKRSKLSEGKKGKKKRVTPEFGE
jgi:hypothetical protein